jgi:hypothetical protein
MIRTPINNGLAQSDIDMAGFDLLNWSGGGGGGTGGGFQYDVTQYGATGDGVTDDGAAIRSALAAIPSTGGLLYFPAGTYKYTGATLVLNKPVTVMGDGGGVHFVDLGPIRGVNGYPAITTIDFNSGTGTLFDVQKAGCMFKDILLRNPGTTAPTAGAGIVVSADGDRTRYQNLGVDGFYINIDVQQGSSHTFEGCWNCAPVLYGLKLRNINVPDGGDHQINNCAFYDGPYSPTSAIRIESGGGVKISNSKIVSMLGPLFVNGIDLAVAAGISTVDLLVSNCSIEGFTGSGIKIRSGAGGFWVNMVITGNQFQAEAGAYGINIDGVSGSIGLISITGNSGYTTGTSVPFIYLANCTGMTVTGNGQSGFSDVLTVGSGVTATSPVYIGIDARLVPVSGGAKLEVRNTSSGTWIEAARWTNP